jgi:hypothetical protein
MPDEFQPGSGEELRWVETAEQETSSATDMQVLPHSGNPTGPHKPLSRGPTDEVTSDLTVQGNASRDFTVPLSFQNVCRYGIYHLPFEQVFAGRWTAAFDSTVLATIASVAAGNKLVASAGTPFADLSAQVPCPVWLCRGGADAIPGQPVLATEVLAAGAELVIGNATNHGITLTDVAEGDDVQAMHSGVLKNGVELIFAMIERAQAAIEQFRVGYGMLGTKIDFSGQKGSDPTWALEFMGREKETAGVTFGTGTQTPAPTTQPFNFGSHFKHFREGGGIDTDLLIRSINWSYAFGGVVVSPAGVDGPYAHTKARQTLTGSVNFFTNAAAGAIETKAEDDVDSAIWYALQRTDGGVTRAELVHLPLVQYSDASQEGGGNDNVVETPVQFMTAKSPTLGYQALLARFEDVPLTL